MVQSEYGKITFEKSDPVRIPWDFPLGDRRVVVLCRSPGSRQYFAGAIAAFRVGFSTLSGGLVVADIFCIVPNTHPYTTLRVDYCRTGFLHPCLV